MGIQRITFDGANVTSNIDADWHHFLLSHEVGILKGLKQECSFTLANNTITFQDGYLCIYGRLLYLENQTAVVVSPDSSKFGYVLLSVDTNASTAELIIKEAVGTYPTLIQTDLTVMDGMYEMVLCAYTKTTTSVTLTPNFPRLMVEPDKTRIAALETRLNLRCVPQKLTMTKLSNGVYRFSGYDPAALSESLLYVVIEYATVVTFPGMMLFLVVGSNTSVTYRLAGADYTMSISVSSGNVTMSLGNTSHRITSAFIKK